MQPETGWSAGQRALLRFLEQQGILTEEPAAPAAGRPTNADLFATFADAIDQRSLVDLVSRALRIASVDLEGFAPMPDLVALVPVEVARRGEVIPIAQYDGTLELAAANPLDLETVKSVEFTTGLRVRTKVALREDVCRALREAYGMPAPAAVDESPEPVACGGDEPVADDGEMVWESPTAPESAAWTFQAESGEAGDEAAVTDVVDASDDANATDGDTDDASGIEWRAVDGDETDPIWEVAEDEAVAAGDEPAPSTGAGPVVPIEHEPLLSIDDGTGDLGRFDDVRLDDPEPAEVEEPAEIEEPPPVEDDDVPAAAPAATVVADAPVGRDASPATGRPAVLVVSRDLTRRVAVREALEASPGAPCVLTMRDEVEARAALALGRVAVVVVEGGAFGDDGRPLWEALAGRAGTTVVWGGRAAASDVVSLDRDTEAADVAARVRALLEERGDD